jgi:hypothetical protein
MQDKQWDNQFEDHAWSEMRRLLDLEMPVAANPRRRFAWFALWLLLLGLLGVGWYWWQAQAVSGGREEPSIEMPAGKDQPVAEETVKTPDAQAPDRLPAKAPSVNRVPALAAEPFRQDSKQERAWNDADAIVDFKINPLPTMRAIVLPDSTGTTEIRAASIAGFPPLPDLISTGNLYLTRLEKERERSGNQKIGNFESAQMLATLDPLPRVAPSLSEDGFTAIFSPSSLPSGRAGFFLLPNEWGVQGTVLANAGDIPNGMALGLTSGYRFGHSRWSLHTGLQYRYDERGFDRENSADQAFSRQENSGGTSNPNSPNSDNEDFGTGTTGQVNNNVQLPGNGQLSAALQSLNLPVLLQYRLGDRFSLQTGIQLNYLLRAKQRSVVEVSPNRFINIQDQELTALVNAQSDQAIYNSLFHQFDVGVSTGLHYRLHPHWRLHLRYHYGLTDLIRSGYYQAHHRYAGLGLTYFFK